MLLQLRGRNGQNRRPGWLERRQMCRGLCRDKGWRALEWGQMVSIHSVKYEQRSCWIDHETTRPLHSTDPAFPFMLQPLCTHTSAWQMQLRRKALNTHVSQWAAKVGNVLWGKFFPLPPSLFLSFPSSPLLQLSLPIPSLPLPFLLSSFLFFFLS